MKETAFTVALAALLCAPPAFGQTVRSGARIDVRTIEKIDSHDADTSPVYHATVQQDVVGTDGQVVFPKGSNADLLVRRVGKHQLVVDLDAVTVNGQRFQVASNELKRKGKRGGGVGHTLRLIGGGAVLGTVIGAVAGGGAGAAIGAGAGAVVGTGAAVLTRGKEVKIPSETVLTFRLEHALVVGGQPN
jgi:hypothetical protein